MKRRAQLGFDAFVFGSPDGEFQDSCTTQRHLNITEEELRKTLTDVWERRRQLKAVGE